MATRILMWFWNVKSEEHRSQSFSGSRTVMWSYPAIISKSTTGKVYEYWDWWSLMVECISVLELMLSAPFRLLHSWWYWTLVRGCFCFVFGCLIELSCGVHRHSTKNGWEHQSRVHSERMLTQTSTASCSLRSFSILIWDLSRFWYQSRDHLALVLTVYGERAFGCAMYIYGY